METLVPITVSSSLLHHIGSYANCEAWVPQSCPSMEPLGLWPERGARHLRAQDTGAHHECIFTVPHEGETSTGVDLGVCIILLNEEPGAVVWGTDPVGTTMGLLTIPPSQNPPTHPPEGSADHMALRTLSG